MAQAQGLKVSVEVSKLLERVREKRAAAEAEQTAGAAKLDEQMKEWREKAIADINAAEPGKYVSSHAPRVSTTSLDRYDRDIALLEMSSEASIIITSQSDFCRYL